MRNFILALFGFVLCAGAAQAEPPLGLDHLIIYSRPGAPEQAALRAAGFTISPDVNHHDGQGTSSVTVEFSNGYLELLYPDAEVSVSDDMKAVAQIFRDRSNWRATGLSPLALQFHRTAATPAQFPFPTFKVHSEWMAPGQSLEMLTPRDMHNAMGLLITPTPVNAAENAAMAADPVKGQRFLHANGARRITDVKIVAPSSDRFPPAASYVAQPGSVQFTAGSEWLMILTLDNARQGKVKDFYPDLPLIVHY